MVRSHFLCHYLQHGLFVGIDQDVLNALILPFPERIFVVWLNDDPIAPAHQGITLSPTTSSLVLNAVTRENAVLNGFTTTYGSQIVRRVME
jgi:hypothetical protein